MTILIGGLDSHLAASWHFHNPFSGSAPLSGGVHMDADGIGHSVVHTLGDAMGALVLVPMKWLNLKQLPLVLWAGIFTISWWSVSILIWVVFDTSLVKEPGLLVISMLVLRNLLLGLLATKVITQPMRGWFDNKELTSVSLVGQEAEISSLDATPENGQAKFKTDGAPLLLNVRTDGPHVPKGTRVWLTHYDPKKRVYIVSATTTTSNTSSNGSKS
ncbi:MAG: hypothetical protein NTY15_19020 [Planctomycetota bacterium]|nr:hypothetical protein [Planctomycetota bacterium]